MSHPSDCKCAECDANPTMVLARKCHGMKPDDLAVAALEVVRTRGAYPLSSVHVYIESRRYGWMKVSLIEYIEMRCASRLQPIGGDALAAFRYIGTLTREDRKLANIILKVTRPAFWDEICGHLLEESMSRAPAKDAFVLASGSCMDKTRVGTVGMRAKWAAAHAGLFLEYLCA